LLPNVDSTVTQQNTVRNLAAFGIRFQSPIPNFAFPSIVGPFNVFDARVSATQTLFDLSAIRRYQAAGSRAEAVKAEGADTRDATTAAVARAYVAALLAQEQRKTAEADVKLAEELVRTAENRLRAGTGVQIEATRAQVELADRRQKVIDRQTRSRAAQMQLARLLGLSFDRDIELTTPLQAPMGEPTALEDAQKDAFEHRSDWQAQILTEKAAQQADSAVKWERLPSVSAFGDYGTIGGAINNAQPTRTIGASLRVPIFDGGRRDARRAESASEQRQESIRTRDLRQQIELELRLALDALNSAAMQTEVAQAGLRLAEDEEARAERRYEAGVGQSLEVTDAQTRLARARQNVLDALGQYNLARIDWSQARGRIETVIP
jgi:outer membrane protein TolC